jgi:predicted metalloendopeptidase
LKIRVALAVLLLAAAWMSIGRAAPKTAANPGSIGAWGVDLANLDRKVAPCEDFYQFAVGNWLATHPIPAAYPSWGSFNIVQNRNQDILHKIVERDAKARAPRGSVSQKVGDFYASGMDEATINRVGLGPVRPLLARIDAVKSRDRLAAAVADLQEVGVNAIFGFSSSPDEKNSNLVIAIAMQGGLGMPDRDYYLKQDERSVKLRAQYLEYVTRLLTLAHQPDPAGTARKVMALETGLATGSYTNIQLRDPNANYHRTTLRGLSALAPRFGWRAWLRGVGLQSATPANIGQPPFFKALDRSLATVPLSTWKSYLKVRLLDAMASALSTPFETASFDFHSRALKGTTQMLPRWKRVLRVVDGEIGEALGQEFVKVAFPPEAKKQALQLVSNLRAALRDDIQKLDWMGPATKRQALAKLAAIREKIGYPDKWRDYTRLRIVRGDYMGDIMRAESFEFHRRLAMIGKPPDRGEWDMTPPTVNAYYNANLNEIVFPAGILQPPFFDPHADPAVNYGGIGAVIGHEMTHGFDDEGSQYDAKGNLRNWWTKEDRTRFEARAECVVNEFSSFEIEPGLKGNGKLVEGEAIADLGGLTLSWMAWQRSLQGKEAPPVLDGFTAAQRFFLSYGQIWEENLRPEYQRLLTRTNPHPIPRFRVNGTVANMPAFWDAFGCGPGTAMDRGADKHCQIW